MGLASILLAGILALVIANSGVESRGCPPPHKVPGYHHTCHGDYDCKNGQICCPNQSHTKSCTYPAPYSSITKRQPYPWRMFIKADVILDRADQIEDINKEYCNGVKCAHWEVCLPDPKDNQKLTCQLPYADQNEV